MLFTSGAFAIFFLVVFHLYWSLQGRVHKQWIQLLLLGTSYYFYAFWDVRLLSLIIFSSLVDYACGRAIEAAYLGRRKSWLWLSVLVNMGLLATFKYFDFFAESLLNLLTLFGLELSWTSVNLVLPVGISFYTFQSLSYSIDVYRRRLAAERDPITFLLYVAFFPQLVAGPIERAKHLLPQFHRPKVFQNWQVISGLRLLLYGLFQKLVIADNLGLLVDFGMNNWTSAGLSLWLIGGLFGLQIFCDFACYSNMAIGLARMLGFDLRANFRAPYSAQSFREFWQRWHISLSSWFRDYVYLPLGGSKRSPRRNAINLMVVFLVSGLWHGAAINFILWGGLHALAMLLERKLGPLPKIPILSSLLLFLLLAALWLPFRAGDQLSVISLIAAVEHWGWPASWEWPLELYTTYLLGVAVVCLFLIDRKLREQDFSTLLSKWHPWQRWLMYYLLIILILLLAPLAEAPAFIYFQF